MAEQIVPLKRRASRIQPEASRHYVGHSTGIHPEDDPYWTDEQGADALPDEYYQPRQPLSTRRYTYTDKRGNQIIQQGNRRLVIHDEPPPKKRKHHALLYVGIGMTIMVLGWIGLQLLDNWWTNYQLNSTYEFPRISQAAEVVGHSDSTDHPSIFIFENLNRQVLIIEYPGGDYTKARIYKGPYLYSDNAEQVPVTAEFKDVNGDGKVDIILHIGDQRVVFLNDGKQFAQQ